jgi:magnesium/cobalt transport protein CorA
VATALLFEADKVDEVDDWEQGLPKLDGSSVLWIDLEAESLDERQLIERLEIRPETAAYLREPPPRPALRDFGECLSVTAYAPGRRDNELVAVSCLVAERWIVTIHDAPLQVLDVFRERASASGDVGHLEGPEFLANLLEWILQSYFAAFDEIEEQLEELDAAAMSGNADDKDGALARLVSARREIGRLRRALTSHREVILALARPELEAITSSSAAERFAALRERLEEAVQVARDARESVLGSFDVLLATTGQRTNDIMKVLTLASVLILPGTLLAGIMGMNFKLGVFTDALYFWVTLVAMALIAIATLVAARMRNWI